MFHNSINPLARFVHFNLDGGGDATGGGGIDTSNSGDVSAATSTEPTPIDVDENSFIRIKGQDKPVKFGEYGRNFQSQFTKASQENARFREKLAEYQKKEAQWQAAQTQSHNQGQNPNSQENILAKLKALPYLTGEQAAETIQSIGDAMSYRDKVLIGTLQELQKMQKIVNNLQSNHLNSSFDGRLNGWLKEQGVPEELKDWAKEMYLAYEGDDLDSEFPTMLKNRWEEINRVISARQKASVEAARKRPFIPGMGGNANPSKPLQFKGNESAKDITDALWETLQGTET